MEVSIQSPMPWFRRFVTGLPSSGFSTMLIVVGFLVDKVTLRQDSLPVLLVSHVGIIILLFTTHLHTNIILIRRSNGQTSKPFKINDAACEIKVGQSLKL